MMIDCRVRRLQPLRRACLFPSGEPYTPHGSNSPRFDSPLHRTPSQNPGITANTSAKKLTHCAKMLLMEDTPLTLLLGRWAQGDSAALEHLAPRVHSELQALARSCLKRGLRHQTLQPNE